MKENQANAFFNAIFDHLSFTPQPQDGCTRYCNTACPELGYSLLYQREGYYSLGIADYTIARDFTLPFAHDMTILRFGMFYHGRTEYQLCGQPISFTTPSSFFVLEDSVNGRQRWRRGQRYRGVEISILPAYFTDVVLPLYPDAEILTRIERNRTYHYIPEEVVRIIEQLAAQSQKGELSALLLESKILECIAILCGMLKSGKDNAYELQNDYGRIPIGQDRQLRLLPSDIRAIQQAHDILCQETCDPPSIAQLSSRVYLSEQKLKAGFAHYYQQPIGAFIHSTRMSRAANLLCTTDLSIDEIARRVGYHYSGNFSRMFKRTYGKSPFEFRKAKAY